MGSEDKQSTLTKRFRTYPRFRSVNGCVSSTDGYEDERSGLGKEFLLEYLATIRQGRLWLRVKGMSG